MTVHQRCADDVLFAIRKLGREAAAIEADLGASTRRALRNS